MDNTQPLIFFNLFFLTLECIMVIIMMIKIRFALLIRVDLDCYLNEFLIP